MTEEAHNIDVAQVEYITGHGFKNPDWISDRGFVATETALKYTQLKKHRFVDMRFISAGMARHKKKSHPIYNRIIWSHYNEIVRELKYGFTEAVKEELRAL
jgi:hypothetical protein